MDEACLDGNDLFEISKLPCHYCEITLSSGIDFIGHKDDFRSTNVIPCCEICKTAKGKMSYDQFNKWIDRLVEAYS